MLLFLHDFRRLIKAGTATVENQSHKTAADQKGKEDTEPYRSGQNREKNEYGQCGFHLITAGSAGIANSEPRLCYSHLNPWE